MTDATTERRPTGEIEVVQPNGLICVIKKRWLPMTLFVVALGAACERVARCTPEAAAIAGIQTMEKSEKVELQNVKAHNNLWEAIERLEGQTQRASDNTDTILRAMPRAWKDRASRRPRR